jgi:8-amino-7-oxononanoate synthase
VTWDSLDPLLDHELLGRARAGLLRARRVTEALGGPRVRIDGRELINFCSNDYLGLSGHPRVVEALCAAAKESGAGAGAAGLISGYQAAHASAEAAIARLKGTEGAVLLPSGYQANHAAVQTLAALAKGSGKRIRFLVDKLSHASLLDAIAAAEAGGASWRVFPHNGMEKLERLLQRGEKNELQVVVSESIFSMDGDAANLAEIQRLKQHFGFVLLLDEAHGTGVYGKDGAGLAQEMGMGEMVDVSIVTLSKAVGCVGGAVCGSRKFCDAVLNLGRAYIFSTSLPGAQAAAIKAAIGVMREEPDRQKRVRELAKRVRESLIKMKVELPAGDSPIVPIIIGEEGAAMACAKKLEESGLLVQAVRPPTVAKGTSRLRVTVGSEHSDEDMERLLGALGKLF